MGKHTIIHLVLCAVIVLTGCASGSTDAVVATATAMEAAPAQVVVTEETQGEKLSVFSDRDLDASYSEADSVAVILSGDSIACDSSSVEVSGNTATIQKEGTYLLSGTLNDGTILIDVDKADKVQLVLNGVTMHSEASAPIYIRQADKVFVTLAEGTSNSLSNGGSFTPDGDTNVDSIIFSKEDLTLNGSGTLSITSPGGHGIVSKDSLRITGGAYSMDVSGHGLCGKDEISIAAGNFDIIAGQDGIHAENSDDTDAGTVYIESGVFSITAEGDGIGASGSCRILDGEYRITTGGGSETVQQNTADPSFDKGQRGGNRPADTMSSLSQQTEKAGRGAGGRGTMGSGKGMDRMNPSQEPMGGQETPASPEQTDTVSAKGIKAAEMTIDGGTFQVDSADDGLHANGNLIIRGGTMEITSGDDGIHGDETLTILSGSISITESYEGMEGQHIQILGGDITLTATDDGLNAAGGKDSSGFGRWGDSFTQSGDTPSIAISGGNVNITASGDGIDANGTLEITGGMVSVSGPTYGDTSVLDYDMTGTITGGTFIGTGASAMTQIFSDHTQGVLTVKVGTQSAGAKITLTDSGGNTILSYTPELDFEIVILSTPEIQPGASYTLHIGETSQTAVAS